MQQARLKLGSCWSYGVLVVVGVALAALVGCTLTGDNVTGVDLSKNGTTSCVKACNDAAFAAREECKKDHETERENCKQMPEPDRTACLIEAEADRDACNAAASTARLECINTTCHRQGSGSAG